MRAAVRSILVALLLLVGDLNSEAQQRGKAYRVGYLGISRGGPFSAAFEDGLRDRGYELGKNLILEYRFAEGKIDRLAALAAELVRLNVDVIVTGINPTIVAAMQATTTIPIVSQFANDPIGAKLIASLAHPGGNLTGLSMDTGDEFLGKRLELMKESAAKSSRLAVLYNSSNIGHQHYLKSLEAPARAMKVMLEPVSYREAGDFENSFAVMKSKQAGGMFLFSDGELRRAISYRESGKHTSTAQWVSRERICRGRRPFVLRA